MRTSLRLILGVVNLLLCFLQCVCTQNCSTGIMPPELDSDESLSVHNPQFNAGFMAPIVHSFLSSVQPNPFPKDLFFTILSSMNTATINKVLQYEAGFLVCVAIGILYIVFMPLIGLCFACCRCCGNCGGHMYQEQTKSIKCRRRSFYWVTFLITFIILAGNICMFLSNTYTHENVSAAPGEFNNTLKNLQSYITTIPKQINQVVNKSFVVVDNVTNNIIGIGPLLGREIQIALEGAINPALDSAALMAQVIQNTSLLLDTLNSTQNELDLLQSNLTNVKARISNTLNSIDCSGCLSLKSVLDMSLGPSIILSNFNTLQSAVTQAEKTDLNTQIQKGKDFFESIPIRVTNATRRDVQMVQQNFQSIKRQVSQVVKDFPLQQLTEFSNTLSTVQEVIKKYTPTINQVEKIRWIIAVILCCLILLVVLCNLFGLILGPAGRLPKDDPTIRSCTANCGGLFLMAGAGFSFIFSWILMTVVLILFLVGGNAYTLICAPWHTQQLFQIIDTPGVIPGFHLSQSLGLNIDLTISEVYNDCQMNKSLWKTLHLDGIINFNDYLNVSNYTRQVQEVIGRNTITLPSIDLLDSETKKQLINFSSIASRFNSSSIMQMNIHPLVQIGYIADSLDAVAKHQTNANIKAELQNEAQDLRFIQTQFNSTILPQLMALDSQIKHFSVTMLNINATVENVLQKVSSAQAVLNNNTTQIVKLKLTEFLDCQMKVFTMLAEWVNNTITEQVGRCGPIAVSVNTVENIFCSQLVDSLNAFWFSLGWCVVFLIPSIIFSVKLAKFYRKMKYKDEFL